MLKMRIWELNGTYTNNCDSPNVVDEALGPLIGILLSHGVIDAGAAERLALVIEG
jgi:hypothetical protein